MELKHLYRYIGLDEIADQQRGKPHWFLVLKK